MEGESAWEGRLEVCFSQRWGTVSSDGWSHTNTRVVCNDLGYDFTGIYIYIYNYTYTSKSFDSTVVFLASLIIVTLPFYNDS